MLDPIMEKQAVRVLDESFREIYPVFTKGRRDFAVRKVVNILSKSDLMVYGIQFNTKRIVLGDYLKELKFKVNKKTVNVIYSVG